MPLYLLHIQNLSAQGEDGLCVAITALLGRTTGGVTLHEEDFASLRVFVRAVGQFARQSAAAHRVLALYAFACLAGGDTCRCGQNHLVANLLGLFRMLFQIVGKSLAHGLLHGSSHLAVAEFGLGLAFKLRLCHLDADNGGETFAEVFAGNLYLRLLYLLGNGWIGIGIAFQRARQCHAETCQMGTSFYGVDVVYVGMDVLAVVGIVHHSHLDGNALLLGLQINHIVEQVGAVAVHVAHELFQSFLGMEHLTFGVAFLVGTQVGERDGDAGIEESQFAHAAGDDVPLVYGGGENRGIGPELLARTAQFRLANHLHRIERLALLVFLLIDFPVAIYL